MAKPVKYILNDIEDLEDDQRDELLLQLDDRIMDLYKQRAQKIDLVSAWDYVEEANKIFEAGDSLIGLSTGIKGVDEMLMGLAPGQVTIISGHTSHGKSQLAINMCYKLSRSDHLTLFVSLEMTHEQIVGRLISLAAKDPSRTPGVSPKEWFMQKDIMLQSATHMNYRDVRALIAKAKQDGCEAVFIDHIHYFSASVTNATEELSRIAKDLSDAAKEFELPIIALCHVRKHLEAGRMPTLDDLKDSSAIAQAADSVLMVYRELHKPDGDPNRVTVRIFKNRHRGLRKGNLLKSFTSKGMWLHET